MKKLLGICCILCVVSLADTIGYIDSQQVLQQYNKSLAAQSDLAQKQKEFQDLLVEKQKELETAQAENKTEEELVQLKQELEQELQPKKDELLELNQNLSMEIEQDIIEATKSIAKQLRVDVVVDKQVIIVGGMDLTSLVLSKLNNN